MFSFLFSNLKTPNILLLLMYCRKIPTCLIFKLLHFLLLRVLQFFPCCSCLSLFFLAPSINPFFEIFLLGSI